MVVGAAFARDGPRSAAWRITMPSTACNTDQGDAYARQSSPLRVKSTSASDPRIRRAGKRFPQECERPRRKDELAWVDRRNAADACSPLRRRSRRRDDLVETETHAKGAAARQLKRSSQLRVVEQRPWGTTATRTRFGRG